MIVEGTYGWPTTYVIPAEVNLKYNGMNFPVICSQTMYYAVMEIYNNDLKENKQNPELARLGN